MTNIETKENLPNIEGKLNKLSNNLVSVNEERLVDICKYIPEKELNNQCLNLNGIFTQELWKKWVDFNLALKKLKSPIGVS